MDEENLSTIDQWFNSTCMVLDESYQLDLRRMISPDTYELIHALSDYYMYENTGLFLHLLGLTSHYLTSTSLVYADNQLKHRLNLHLLLVVRAGKNISFHQRSNRMIVQSFGRNRYFTSGPNFKNILRSRSKELSL